MFTVERMLNILKDPISKSTGHIWLILADTSFRITDFIRITDFRTTKSALSWWCTSLQQCRLEQLSFASCQMLSVIQQRRAGTSLRSKEKFLIPLFSFPEICFSTFPHPCSPRCYQNTINKNHQEWHAAQKSQQEISRHFRRVCEVSNLIPCSLFQLEHVKCTALQCPSVAVTTTCIRPGAMQTRGKTELFSQNVVSGVFRGKYTFKLTCGVALMEPLYAWETCSY